MPVLDTFSKRQRRLSGTQVDVLTYDRLPPKLRIQIVKIWEEGLGRESDRREGVNPAYVSLCKELAAEFGLRSFGSGWQHPLSKFFIETADEEQALDIVDVTFRQILKWHKNLMWKTRFYPEISAEVAARDLNTRFQEQGIGYQFLADGSPGLIRKDNEYLHGEVTLPALSLLHDSRFEGANLEFRSAHEHHRHARYKECLNEALKAFESTMKTICTIRGWSFDPNQPAAKLIETCIQHGLVPPFMQSSLATVPTLRNKLSAHGQGDEIKVVPQHLAEYALHESAATIVLLFDALGALSE